MIPTGVQVFIALERIDLRYGFERLSGCVRERIGYDARSGALYVFVGKQGTAVKILFFDGTGLCVFYKRLDRGTFVLPDAPTHGATHVEVEDTVLEALLDGIAIAPTGGASRTRRDRFQ
jgi:transposase